MIEKKNLIRCSTIIADCTNEEITTARINGKNAWRFEFYVLRQEANDIIFNTLIKLSGYNFCEYGVHMGEDVYVTPGDVWTMDSIEECLNNNLGFTPKSRITLKLEQ